MRRILFLFLLALTGLQMYAGDVVITVGNLTWGENNELEISMANDVEVNGFQMDLVLPDGLALSEDGHKDVEPSVTDRVKGLTVMCRAMPSGKYRFVVFSISGKKVAGKEGVIMRVPLKEKEHMGKGRYEVRVVNASASVTIDGKMEGTKIPASTSIIEVK